jgi:hypothetical protein
MSNKHAYVQLAVHKSISSMFSHLASYIALDLALVRERELEFLPRVWKHVYAFEFMINNIAYSWTPRRVRYEP